MGIKWVSGVPCINYTLILTQNIN